MTKSPQKNVPDMGSNSGPLACQADTLPIELPCPVVFGVGKQLTTSSEMTCSQGDGDLC